MAGPGDARCGPRAARRPGRLTLYPVTADSCSAALTRSQLSSTLVSVVFQMTFPGGRLGAGKTEWKVHSETSTEGQSARAAVTGGQQRGGPRGEARGGGGVRTATRFLTKGISASVRETSLHRIRHVPLASDGLRRPRWWGDEDAPPSSSPASVAGLVARPTWTHTEAARNPPPSRDKSQEATRGGSGQPSAVRGDSERPSETRIPG